MGLISKHLIVE